MKDLARAIVASFGLLTVVLLLRTQLVEVGSLALLIAWVVFMVSALVGALCMKEKP